MLPLRQVSIHDSVSHFHCIVRNIHAGAMFNRIGNVNGLGDRYRNKQLERRREMEDGNKK